MADLPKEPNRYVVSDTYNGPQMEVEIGGAWVMGSDYDKLRSEAEALRADAERYRAIKWNAIFHLDADEAGPAAEKFDSGVDEIVKNYRVLRTDAAIDSAMKANT